MATISDGLRRLAAGNHNLDFVPVTNGRLIQAADTIDALVAALDDAKESILWLGISPEDDAFFSKIDAALTRAKG